MAENRSWVGDRGTGGKGNRTQGGMWCVGEERTGRVKVTEEQVAGGLIVRR